LFYIFVYFSTLGDGKAHCSSLKCEIQKGASLIMSRQTWLD